MKYVALLSGGKDSCFNLLHCRRNDHHLVAAATLSPPSGHGDVHSARTLFTDRLRLWLDEIDSYMYQTVGQDAITLVAQALDIPLYRRVIQGSPLEQAAEYGFKTAGGGGIVGDETEDLYALLSNVLHHHPDIQAVSVGAILSNYQRVRVEHVCRRLSLTPLAYLWQRNQTSLLSEMIASGLSAILLKIAGAGLTPSDLAKSLSSVRPKILSLHQRFGTHPCGEGGEYETFTTDSPLFKYRIDIKEKEIIVVDRSDVAPVAYLRIKDALLVNKETTSITHLDVPAPPLLENPFEILRTVIEDSSRDALPGPADLGTDSLLSELAPSVRRIGPWIAVGNVHLPRSDSQPLNLGEEVTRCFEILQSLLTQSSPVHGDLLPTSAMITLLLPNLNGSTFSAANSAYAPFFGASPPARACIGVGGVGIGLDCLAWVGERSELPDSEEASKKITGETGTRKALHVQSLSYWAPANIGPYSQAISIPPYTFVSGQIGLIPSSLSLPSPSSESQSSTLPLETALASQHTARIIRAAPNSGLGDGSEGGFGASDDSINAGSEGGWTQLAIYYLVHATDADHIRKHMESIDGLTPTVYAVLSSLPRGARMEKQVLVHSGRFIVFDPELSRGKDKEDDSMVKTSPKFTQGDVVHLLRAVVYLTDMAYPGRLLFWNQPGNLLVQDPECCSAELEIHYEISGFPHSSEACAVVFIRHLDVHRSPDTVTSTARAAIQIRAIEEFKPFIERTLISKAFVSHHSSAGGRLVLFLNALFRDEMPAVTIVPSHYVTSRAGDGWDWAVTLMAV